MPRSRNELSYASVSPNAFMACTWTHFYRRVSGRKAKAVWPLSEGWLVGRRKTRVYFMTACLRSEIRTRNLYNTKQECRPLERCSRCCAESTSLFTSSEVEVRESGGRAPCSHQLNARRWCVCWVYGPVTGTLGKWSH